MLRDLLRGLRTARDTTRLFVHLGYAPDDTPVADRWVSVARWRTYPVLAACVTDAPRDAARAMARRLSATARPALVAALGPPGEIVFAAPRIGTPGASRVLAVPLVEPSAAALRLLERFGPNGSPNVLSHALRVADLLATEEAGERFFVAFRGVLERMVQGLAGRGSDADRTMASLLALTRILFLYFVQAKGWLDGRTDYLRVALDTTLAHGRHFHRAVLHPLFFGTLNRRPARRTARAALGTIPYLNGGLFEPHAVERRIGPVVFPNALWRDAFDGLFERFRFCVREAEEVDAIAPDMLGRVFERVMATDERHRTGTFYTPEHVVRDLVATTLAVALERHTGWTADETRALLAGEPVPGTRRRVAQRAIGALRILDPAVGSGAFLLGALEILTAGRRALATGNAPRVAAIRRFILRNNLFGVDVSPVAVRLAELRLWLAVVADDPTQDITRIAPLPNLDGVVRQGDALLDPVGAGRALGLPYAPSMHAGRAVASARAQVFGAAGESRRSAERALRDAELTTAKGLLADAIRRTRLTLRELASLARSRDLFGERTGLTEPQQRHRDRLKHHLRTLRACDRRLAEGEIPFFSFEVHHADVLARGGFSAVVGNPPWVRAERLDAEHRAALKARFKWWQPGSGHGYGHLPDLSVAFVERALELAAPDGAIGLLVPSKLASATYAARARESLVKESEVRYLRRLPERDAAGFGATAYPLVLVARKRAPEHDHAILLQPDGSRTARQTGFAGGGPWILLPDRARAALERFLAAGPPFGTALRPQLGVKTGADAALVGTILSTHGDVATVRFGSGNPVPIERHMLRSTLRGRDVGPFHAAPRLVLFWAHDASGVPLSGLPPLAARYAAEIAETLRRRTDYTGRTPVWTVFRTAASCARWRLVWADIARRPGAVLLERAAAEAARSALPLNSCYVCAAPNAELALAAAAVLNSTWAAVAVRATADEARGGYRRHNMHVIARLPLPPRGRARVRLARAASRAHRSADVDQAALDELVADSLALTASDRAHLLALVGDPG